MTHTNVLEIAEVLADHEQRTAAAQPAQSMFAQRHQLEYFARLMETRMPQTMQRCGERLAKAIRIAYNAGNVYETAIPQVYHVRGSHDDAWYEVDTCLHSCTCMDHQQRGSGPDAIICKHRLAVGLLVYGPQLRDERIATESHSAIARDPQAIRMARQAMENAWYYQRDLSDKLDKLDDPNDPEYREIHDQIDLATRKAQAAQKEYYRICEEYNK